MWSHYTSQTIYVFCSKNSFGTQGVGWSTVKMLYPRWFTLPAALMRWSFCDTYFVCLSGFYHETFHFVSYLAPGSLCFVSVLFSIVITSLGEEKAGRYASHALVCLSCMRYIFVLFSSSWCRGLAADCDCGNP